MASVTSVSSSGSINLSWVESLVSQAMAVERQPLSRLQQQKDTLDIRRAVYTDMTSKFSALRSALQSLTGTSSVFNQMAVSSANTAVVGVTSGSNPSVGLYTVVVNRLAQVHQISSSQQNSSTSALNLSGSLVVGGAASRSASLSSALANTVVAVDVNSETGAIRDGQEEIGSGVYSVEVRQVAGTGEWQFRVVDANGQAVSVDDVSDSGTLMTSDWQDISLVTDHVFDTGRGLKITFGNDPNLYSEGSAALNYTAKGATINLQTSDSLEDIKGLINSATYAEGHEVTASVVNRRLILTGVRTGSDASISISGAGATALGFDRDVVSDAAQTVSSNGVTGFSASSDLVNFTAGSLNGIAQLAADRYYVEIGSGDNANKFRLKDSAGNVVAIASTSGGSTATTSWIAIGSGGTYDTGRGLKIIFSQEGTYTARSAGSDAANILYDNPTIQEATDASLTVNGLSVNRSQNTGLIDVIGGVSLSINSLGTTQISISKDDNAVVDKVKDLLSKINDVLSYIKVKTQPQRQSSTDSERPTYTPAVLGGDFSLKSLRYSLISDLLSTYSDADANAPTRLSNLGITVDSNGAFTLSSEATLRTMLAKDRDGVAELLANLLDKVETRISPYLDGTDAILTRARNSAEEQLESISQRIGSTEARLKVREEALRKQYQSMMLQIRDWQSQLQAYGNLFNQLY